MISREKLDGVVVAVPNELHLPVGATCAKKGLHLLMEKPIAADLESADLLIQAVKENNVHLMVGHHRRHNPFIEELRNAIRGGKIGKLVGVTVLWSLYKPRDYFQGPFAWRAIVPLVNWSFLASTVVFPFNLTAILLPSSMISYEFHFPAV